MLNALIVTNMRIRTMSYFARCARRNHAKPSSVQRHTIQKINTKVPSIGFCYPSVIVIDLVKLWSRGRRGRGREPHVRVKFSPMPRRFFGMRSTLSS
jgi:hypothetical protein